MSTHPAPCAPRPCTQLIIGAAMALVVLPCTRIYAPLERTSGFAFAYNCGYGVLGGLSPLIITSECLGDDQWCFCPLSAAELGNARRRMRSTRTHSLPQTTARHQEVPVRVCPALRGAHLAAVPGRRDHDRLRRSASVRASPEQALCWPPGVNLQFACCSSTLQPSSARACEWQQNSAEPPPFVLTQHLTSPFVPHLPTADNA